MRSSRRISSWVIEQGKERRMFEWIEQFCKAHERTIAAIEAVSTFSAVVVSLALASMAQRANRTKLKAYLNRSFIMHSSIDPNNRPKYITVGITNTGVMPLRIPLASFHWRRGLPCA